jgi:hypothetical protein
VSGDPWPGIHVPSIATGLATGAPQLGTGTATAIYAPEPADPKMLLRNLEPLDYPTRPVLAGHILFTSNSDSDRCDNSPNDVEINPAGASWRLRTSVPGSVDHGNQDGWRAGALCMSLRAMIVDPQPRSVGKLDLNHTNWRRQQFRRP